MTRTARELAQYLGAKITGDDRAAISGVAAPEQARAEDLIYVDSPRHQQRAQDSAARCVVAPVGLELAGKTLLAVQEPKFVFAKAAAWLLPRTAPKPGIHATAIVASSARLAGNVFVGPYVVVEDEAEIGAGSVVEAFCFLGREARLGESCWLHPRVTLYAGARLGNGVEVHSGSVIGGDGFGYIFGEGRHQKFPQIGTVEIGENVEIGCNSTIDRGSLGTTRIEAGAKIDNLVQIAHNASIGEHSVVASQTGISGSSLIGKGVILAGQVGIADHCNVEDGAVVGAQAGVPTGKTIRSGQTVWGTPARPIERFKKQYAVYSRLPELAERVRKLEREREEP
jgi:UDP-3-O-[3-hydroxymyristoyl] glucosamine N-acyltransferase